MEFYIGLKPFCVKYKGHTPSIYEQGLTNDEIEDRYYEMQLENMVYTETESEPWSFIDLKMGTNCVLREPDDPKYKLFYDRDVNTTT